MTRARAGTKTSAVRSVQEMATTASSPMVRMPWCPMKSTPTKPPTVVSDEVTTICPTVS